MYNIYFINISNKDKTFTSSMVKENKLIVRDGVPRYRQICGGLEMVNPLINYPEEPIYKKLLGNKLSVKYADGVSEHIMEDLKKDPITTPEFVKKFHHFNQIEWAQVKADSMENSSKQSKVRYFKQKKDLHYYKITVDKKFIESNKLRKKCEVLVLPNNNGCSVLWNPDEQYSGFVDDIYERDSQIIVKFFSSKIYPPEHMDPSLTYQVIALPSLLVFNTRCRTLAFMSQFPGSCAECIFPSYRNQLAKQLISMIEYEFRERHFISSTTFSPNRQFNEKQKIAIHAIVSGWHGKVPYILFGPPGTGKTVTLVESVRLICENDPMARVLVCTPSNTAADAFTLGLMSTNAFTSGSILRIFSLSKHVYEQNGELFDKKQNVLCIKDTAEGPQFGIPPKTELIAKKRVLICTLNTSTYLISGDMIDCFTHIIIDEAGQADELETLIPIVGLISFLNRKTKIIFAGDPKQLGPVQTCDPLKKLANSSALIERLTGGGSFDFDKRITTMLQNNYRSHPAFLTIPSQLYYGGKLCPSAPIETKNTLCLWNDLPNKNNFPLIWHSIVTPEQRDLENKSYQNLAECDVVCGYVQKLTREANVKAKDIGIITPYRFQIKLLRSRFSKTHPQMLIDSVERFQGCERRVIIISTVRSNGIGFLDCQKRFNTAVTRPMELLIIVGDCRNMAKVRCWQRLINYCEENGALINFGSLPLAVIQKKPLLVKNNDIVEEIITLKKRNNRKPAAKFSHAKPSFLKKNSSKKARERWRRNIKNNQTLEEYNVKKEENSSDSDSSTSVDSIKERLSEIKILALNYRCDEQKNDENKTNPLTKTTKNLVKLKLTAYQIARNNQQNQAENIKNGKKSKNNGFALGTRENPIIIASPSPRNKNKNIKNPALPAVSNNNFLKLEELEEEMKQLNMTKKWRLL